ncbi:MAG TPA: hypothetical protein VL403_05590 [Candidatus Kryptonia bacterium]|nr:hypothetical protein [Candidatus Kryptonia bacterium]
MNILPSRVVVHSMGSGRCLSLSARMAVAALVVVTLFVSVARPVSRPADALTRSLGRRLTRLNLRAEASVDNKAPVPLPAEGHADALDLALVGVLLLLLKTRRAALHPVPVRRLKIPLPSTADSRSSD